MKKKILVSIFSIAIALIMLSTIGSASFSDGHGYRDGHTDSDNDGLCDTEEENHHTDEDEKDTDEDNLDDGDEVEHGSDPEDDKDTDNDGLEDGEEHEHGCDPTKEDTDGDGVNDKEEHDGENDPCRTPNSVPEFPTLTIPMLAVFGLVFIVRNRNKKVE